MKLGVRHKMQLKGKGHWLRAWTHVCGLWAGTDSQLENTECAALLRPAVSLKTSPYCSHQVYATKLTAFSSQEQSRERAETPAWVSLLEGWDFFAVVANLVASLDTDCRFFNIFACQIDLNWATKSRNQLWGSALFLQLCMLLSSERKSERNPASWQLYRKDFFSYQLSKCDIVNFADSFEV